MRISDWSSDVCSSDLPVAMASGIVFLTYATLRSQRHDRASRLQQLLDWAGPDFDGVILLDESHALGNADGTETEFGAAKRSVEHTSELQSLMRISYAVFCWKNKRTTTFLYLPPRHNHMTHN